MVNNSLKRFGIGKKNDSGFSFTELCVVLFVIFIIFLMVVVPGSKTTNRSWIDKQFGISDVYILSVEEKIMLRPMVENRINEMRTKVDEAIVSVNRLKSRSDINPKNADVAVQELRVAKNLVQTFQYELNSTCSAAKKFNLVDDKFKGCN